MPPDYKTSCRVRATEVREPEERECFRFPPGGGSRGWRNRFAHSETRKVASFRPLVEQALADLIEKHRNAKPRPHVLGAYLASPEEHESRRGGSLYPPVVRRKASLQSQQRIILRPPSYYCSPPAEPAASPAQVPPPKLRPTPSRPLWSCPNPTLKRSSPASFPQTSRSSH